MSSFLNYCKSDKCLFSTKTFVTVKDAEACCAPKPKKDKKEKTTATLKKKEKKSEPTPAAPTATPPPQSSSELEILEANAVQQGTIVRALKKAEPRDNEAIASAVAELKRLKALVEAAKPSAWNRQPFDDMMIGRFVYAPSFEAYGGVAGFYDYGPVGCAIKNNLLTAWREHFIIHDNMHQIDCPAMTPEHVLEASGHVQRFTDIMVKDMVNGECIRADHLLEEVMTKRVDDSNLSPGLRKQTGIIHTTAAT